MITTNFHTHCTYCDGKDTPEEMIKTAIDKGFTALGFSSHSFYGPSSEYTMSHENEPLYFEEINRLKEVYKGKIEILCGIEQDYYSGKPQFAFDYIIGSVHYIKCGSDYLSVDLSPEILKAGVQKYFGGDIYAFCEKYYSMVSEIIERTGADIIGHFDLISKFNENGDFFDSDHPRYVAAYRAAVDKLIKYNKPFEINTGAISRGYRVTPYPSAPIKKYIEEKGGSFVLSSDSHQKETICFKFDEFHI